ncbi:MAG TPA: HDOD domain-containing protein [Opitutaceae bacterium]|jgi:HD-like signal output (HDOD) protein|nr:HDOD domain-containing protein [Opitutaceae bacterium]
MGPDDVVRELRQMPSTPKVLPRLLEILRDDHASIEDVVALIKVDAGMAARVLQIANSAYYSGGNDSRAPTMDEAVYRVGLVKVYELVAFAATSQLLMRTLKVYNLDPDQMWQRAVTCAMAAERLAARLDGDFNVAYTCGLLHNLGLVAIDGWAAATNSSVRLRMDPVPSESTDAEKRQLGFTNASVAGALLRSWGFPSSIVEPIRWQYSPGYAGKHQRMAAILHAAKWLRDAVHIENPDERPEAPEPALLKMIPCAREDLDEMLFDIKAAYDRACLLLAPAA